MREWNAATYHRVSNPQFEWGRVVLDRLRLSGDETVVDVGCGTGRLTALLAGRVADGRVLAVDASMQMLAQARTHLAAAGHAPVHLLRADAAALPIAAGADAIFSTATFHWVLDHDRLFRSLFAALKPGGRLVAQCGGGPNIRRVRDRAAVLMREPPFAPWFESWQEPWYYADAETTATRLTAAGFIDIETDVQPAPTTFPEASSFAEFLTNVICHPYLALLPAADMRTRFVAALTQQAASDDPRYELDYWRLNMSARRPA